MASQPHGRSARSVAACTALVGWLAAAATARQAVPVYGAVAGGPSVLMSSVNGASPYTGVGRYEGQATCTAFFLATVPPTEDGRNAPAYALTSGHCAASLGPNEVLSDGAGIGRVVFNYFADSERWQIAVPVAGTAYATAKGRDVAVLELAVSYHDLAGRLVRPWRVATAGKAIVGDPIAIVGAPLRSHRDEAFLRLATCRSEGVAPFVVEHTWHWLDAPFNRCRDIAMGSSGSPVLSLLDQRVLGLVTTTTAGASPLTECALDHPCEPMEGGVRSRRDTNYVTSLAGISLCFDGRRRFSVDQAGCPLDPGTGPQATPSFVGAVNPRLATQPIGKVARTWNVTVATNQPFYRYAIASPPLDDCRTTTTYTSVLSVSTTPTIDVPLPLSEGFALLCIVGTATREGSGAGDAGPHVTIVVARTDVTPPRLPAQVTIADGDAAWQVTFDTFGTEVSFHAFKVGSPSATRCEEAVGYRLALAPFGLPKTNAPYVLCAIPYDAAQNAGRLLERLLS
jgi:hypothetical protein